MDINYVIRIYHEHSTDRTIRNYHTKQSTSSHRTNIPNTNTAIRITSWMRNGICCHIFQRIYSNTFRNAVKPTALLGLIRDKGLLSGLDAYLAPHLEEGSAGKKALDMFGLFNVTQMALEIPSTVPGISGKYGVQMNIVKPDIHPTTGNYFLQLFPLHDEVGINFGALPGPLQKFLSQNPNPWFGVTAQVVRNHGIELPL